MHDVFAYAEERAMGVFFADDVDTISANPQELILTLPPDARFVTAGKQGPVLACQSRYAGRLPLLQGPSRVAAGGLSADHLPGGLVPQRRHALDGPEDRRNAGGLAGGISGRRSPTRPRRQSSGTAHNMFAIGKIVRAFDRALCRVGPRSACNWPPARGISTFLPAADRFLPPHVKLIGLDYGVLHDKSQLADAERRQVLAAVGAHRRVVPVIWAQHDDGNYIGRLLHALRRVPLEARRGQGGRLRHHPLDHASAGSVLRQPCQAGLADHQGPAARTTCDEMAERSFGARPAQNDGRVLWNAG